MRRSRLDWVDMLGLVAAIVFLALSVFAARQTPPALTCPSQDALVAEDPTCSATLDQCLAQSRALGAQLLKCRTTYNRLHPEMTNP